MVNAMRMMKYAFMAMAAMLLATPAFAQAAGEATSPVDHRSVPVSAWRWQPGFAAWARVAQRLRLPRRWRVTRELVLVSLRS